MNLPVFFDTLEFFQCGLIKVWLRHPHRILICELSYLRQQERESKQGNSFPVNRFIEYRTLDPIQDSKMQIMFEVPREESLTFSNNYAPVELFTLDRSEMTRIEETVRSIQSLRV